MEDVPTNAESSEDGVTRRNFYIGAIYGLGAVIGAALGLPAAIYLLLPPKVRRTEDWTDLGDVTHLTPNSPTEMTFRRTRVDGWRVTGEKATAWLVKKADNSVVAYGPNCTHLGCAYHWSDDRDQFVCPCHNSFFSIDGKVLEGPARRPLDRYQTKVEGKNLLLGPLNKPGQSS